MPGGHDVEHLGIETGEVIPILHTSNLPMNITCINRYASPPLPSIPTHLAEGVEQMKHQIQRLAENGGQTLQQQLTMG